MKKVFNINKVKEVLDNISSYYTLNEYNIYNKNAIKLLKEHIVSNYVINNMNKILSEEDFNNLIKKFFPIKFALLEGEKINFKFKTKQVYYSDVDKKIHWILFSNGEERHFKLKTSNIYPRVEEYITSWFNKIKKEIDKLYGYWIEETNDGWFITDMNKNRDDSYKIIVMNKNLKIIKNSISFGNIKGFEDLYIKE